MNRICCTNCYYSEPEYDKYGLVVGVSCKKDAFKFMPWGLASEVHCGNYSEADE